MTASAAPRMMLITVALVLSMTATSGCAGIQLSDITRVLTGSGALDEATVADGLRQALAIGTERATAELSAQGGFDSNPALRLVLPEQLDPLVDTARNIGLGGWVDSLEDTMNRAAEAAAGEALPVFADAIREMTIADAFEILRGTDDAATRYFREKTAATLEARFTPVVTMAMEEVGLYAQYQKLVGRYEVLPFSKPMPPSLEGYVTQKTLDGLFSVLAAEEARIRDDPAARTTELLRKVFGSSPFRDASVAITAATSGSGSPNGSLEMIPTPLLASHRTSGSPSTTSPSLEERRGVQLPGNAGGSSSNPLVRQRNGFVPLPTTVDPSAEMPCAIWSSPGRSISKNSPADADPDASNAVSAQARSRSRLAISGPCIRPTAAETSI